MGWQGNETPYLEISRNCTWFLWYGGLFGWKFLPAEAKQGGVLGLDNASLFQLPPDVKATHNTNFKSDTTLKYMVVTKEHKFYKFTRQNFSLYHLWNFLDILSLEGKLHPLVNCTTSSDQSYSTRGIIGPLHPWQRLSLRTVPLYPRKQLLFLLTQHVNPVL